MTRQSKIITFGCFLPLLLIGLCAGTLYFGGTSVLGRVAGLWGDSTEDVLADLSDNQAEPAIDWTVISERSAPIGADSVAGSESDQAAAGSNTLPQPVITVEEVDVVRVKVQNQTGQIDTKAAGVSKSAEIVAEDGQSSFVFEYNEANLNEMVLTTANSEMPPELKSQVILEQVELRPGALVVSGQVNPGVGGWQSLGVISTVGSSGKSLEIVGIDIGGAVLDASSAGPMQELFSSVEQEINQTLQNLAVISGNGVEVSLDQIYLGDGILQIVFEN